MRTIRTVGVVLVALVVGTSMPTAPARAQMFSGTIDNFASNQFTQLQMQNIRRSAAYAEDDDEEWLGPEAAFTDARDVASLDLRFEPDRAVRKRMVRTLRAQVAEASPEDAEVVSRSVFSDMARALKPYGLSVNDLADTSAVYLGEVFDAANGTSSKISAETAQALSGQFRDAYAVIARDEPRLFDAGLVQEQSDAFLLQAFVVSSMRQTLAQPAYTDAQRSAFQDAMVRLGREAFGIDLTRATIDERGLTPGEAIGALDGAVREHRAERAITDPEAEAARATEAALGSPCGLTPRDGIERKAIRLFETRGACEQYDPARYDAFLEEAPANQHYAINFVSWYGGGPLYPADQAKIMDGMIE